MVDGVLALSWQTLLLALVKKNTMEPRYNEPLKSI